jgi:hypothetical protein
MTTTSKTILTSGWAIFLGITLVISILLDLYSPDSMAPYGRGSFRASGSATVGWLFVVLIMVVPAWGIREIRNRPVPDWLALLWVVTVGLLWVLAQSFAAEQTGRPLRFNLSVLGALVLCWRFLRWPPDRTALGTVYPTQQIFYFRRKGQDRIEGFGSLLQIRAHLMKQGGWNDVEITEKTGIPMEEIQATSWRPLR